MKGFYLFCLAFICLSSSYAQNFPVSGKVTDLQHHAVAGATVGLHGFSRHTVTDGNGQFLLPDIPSGDYVLEISGAGFHTFSQPLLINTPVSNILIQLSPAAKQLNEVLIRDKHHQEFIHQQSMNVQSVSSDEIRKNLGGSLMKSLERLPGIKTIGIGSGQSKPLIRGLGFNRVVVVEHGVKHEGQQWGADHGLEIDQFAAGTVELVKGAASFIYGSDAIAGAIDIKPHPVPLPHTAGATVDLVAKSNNDQLGTSLNLFGRNDHWFFDGRITHQEYGDFRVPTDTVYVYDYAVDLHQHKVRNTAGKETDLHLSGGLIRDNFRSVFYLSNTFSKSGFFANAHGLEPRRVDADLHDASSRDILNPYQQVNHLKLINRSYLLLNNHALSMELGYQKNLRKEFSNYVNHGYMPPVYPAELDIPDDLERKFDKNVYSLNLKDAFSIQHHELTAGINAEHQRNAINGWSFLVPAYQQFTTGVFLYDRFKINDAVSLHGALRYDHGRIEISAYRDWFPSATGTADQQQQAYLYRAEALNRQFNSLIWSAGLNYDKNQFSLKANIGKSFRMPIAKELAANGINYHYFSYEKGDASLAAEKSYQLDLGLGWKEQLWSVNFTPFYNYFPNYIYLNPTSDHDYFYGAGNQVFQYAQSKVMRYGAELSLSYNFMKNLTAAALGEYLYARQLSGDKKGYTLPFSPPPSLLLNLSYTPVFKGRHSGTYFSIDYRMTARQDNIVPPERKTPGSSIVNLAIGTAVRIGNQTVTVGIQGQNLLNKKYFNHTSFYRLIDLPETGRNVILSLKIPVAISSHKTSAETK